MDAATTTRINKIWLLLSALTLVSWGLVTLRGEGHLDSSVPEAFAVLVIAAVKARFVIRDFMEVRAAPLWLRRFTDAWLVGLTATVLAMYLYK